MLVAQTPAHTAGNVAVSVRCTAGITPTTVAFAFAEGSDPAPLITAVEPGAAAPGETVTIRGLGFRGDDVVTFDSTPATLLDVTPDASSLRVPELAPAGVRVHLTDRHGRTTTYGPLFSVLGGGPPRVTSTSATRITAGAEIELRGEAFRPPYSFRIGGRAAKVVASTATAATVRVDASVAEGVHPIEVVNAAGALVSIGPTVTVAAGGLLLSDVTPRCTTTEGSILVTIHGAGLDTGARVTFNGVPASEVSVIDAKRLTARVPPGVAGKARIVVTRGSESATLTNVFTYESPFAPHSDCAGRRRAARH